MEVIVVVLGCIVGWIFWATDPWGLFSGIKKAERDARERHTWEKVERDLKARAEREAREGQTESDQGGQVRP